ncbi:hypothetical protein JCM8097_004038 [Rhodosporidiobolus ruineniae]
MIPTAADRAPKDGHAPVIVGSAGAQTADSATANAIRPETYDHTQETGGRMAHANQQVADGFEPKQIHPHATNADGSAGGASGEPSGGSGGEGLKPHAA